MYVPKGFQKQVTKEELIGKITKTVTGEELDFSEWRKKNTIMTIRGGWFGNQTPCYAGDGQPKTEKEWRELFEQFKAKSR